MRADSEVYFVDNYPAQDVIDILLSPDEENDNQPRLKSLTILDHHNEDLKSYRKPKASKGFKAPELELKIDIEEPSAASLTWKHFFPEDELPELFEWINMMEQSTEFPSTEDTAVMSFIDSHDIHSSPEKAFESLSKVMSVGKSEAIESGYAILADQENNIALMLQNIRYAALRPIPRAPIMYIPIVNGDVKHFGRYVTKALLDIAVEGTNPGVGLAWYQKGDGSVLMSIRTNGYPDAGRLARHLGEKIGCGGNGRETMAAVQFKDLAQFVENVPTYKAEEVRDMAWEKFK